VHKFETYLALVRAALWGGEGVWPENQTDTLLLLNAQQGTGPLVYPCIIGQESVSSYARAQMKGVCVHTMQQHVHLQYTLEQAWTALEKAGIHPVLMKGAGLAALYPEPQRRQWGDIDLFVGKQQYHPACAVMRETFPDALKFDEELDHYKHYNLIADGVSIEVHRVSVGLQHPVDERRYERFEQEGMSQSTDERIGGLVVRVPEPTFNALFVFMHAWEHMMTKGANMRQLCDLTLLLHHYCEQIERPRLNHYLRSLHLMDVWQLFMWILVEHIGLPADKAPFYSKSERLKVKGERLLSDLLALRLVAPEKTKTAPTNRILRKLFTMRERLRNAHRIRQYSPAYARHMIAETLLHGAQRFFAKDRHWE